MSAAMSRPPAPAIALAVACALVSLATLCPPAVRAADGLILTSATRYEVRPAERLVAVTIDAIATNVTPDTATERTYYPSATLTFQADATQIAATSGGRPLAVTVVESTDEFVAAEIIVDTRFFHRTLPRSTRLLMEAWDFGAAAGEIDEVHDVIEDRVMLEELAADLELDSTDALRAAFEDEGLNAAAAEVTEQTAALEAIDAASERIEREATAVEQIGLLGEAGPAAALDGAREAYEAGDDDTAAELAATAIERRSEATDRGRLRTGVVGGAILGIDLLAMAGLAYRGRRRRARARSEVTAA